jgi:hypothetical protein
MSTRGERSRRPITRFAVAGALALAVLFTGTELQSVTSNAGAAVAHRAVIAPDAKANPVTATAARAGGTAWVASLLGAVAYAVLGAHLLRSIREGNRRRALRRFSFRLRAPPAVFTH